MADRRARFAIVATVATLALANVVANRVVASWAVVPWNLFVVVCILAWTRLAGLTSKDLGVDRQALRRGWHVGRWFVFATLIVFSVGLAIPATRELFEDQRVRSLGWIQVGWHTLVAVPVGTVLLEELAFRSALPAMFELRVRRRSATLWASLLFGLWHVLPAWEIYRVNPTVRDLLSGTVGRVVGVVAGVASTALIGVAWCWLRYRTASLLTTVIAHAATNSLGYVFAFIAWSLN